MRIVASIESAALPDDLPEDDSRLRGAAASLAALVRAGHELVVAHGESAGAATGTASRLVLALNDMLPGRTVIALVWHTELGAHDPLAHRPETSSTPSPAGPRAVVETPVIRELLTDGTVVICPGGSGVSVVRERGTDRLRTVAAVADPARTAALLAVALDADALLFLSTATHLFTARDHLHRSRPLLRLSPQQVHDARLPQDVREKAEAAADFVTDAGGLAAIGPVGNALGILQGATGTEIRIAPATSPA